MRKGFVFLCATLLLSCQTQEISIPSMKYTYDAIDSLLISWEGLFDVKDAHYYALIFSKSCHHCLAIEEAVVRYALSESVPEMYFIQATPYIPKGKDISSTLGATTVDEIFILGWPTLLEIEEDTLIGHLAGEKAILKKLT